MRFRKEVQAMLWCLSMGVLQGFLPGFTPTPWMFFMRPPPPRPRCRQRRSRHPNPCPAPQPSLCRAVREMVPGLPRTTSSHGCDQLLPRNGDGHEPCPVGIEVARSRHRDLNRDAAHRDVHDDRIITEINFVAPAVGAVQDGVHRTVSWYRQRSAGYGNSGTPATDE